MMIPRGSFRPRVALHDAQVVQHFADLHNLGQFNHLGVDGLRPCAT